MTQDQQKKIRQLLQCRMMAGSPDKRFIRDVCGRPDDYELSEKQAGYLDSLYHRYRRQLSNIP